MFQDEPKVSTIKRNGGIPGAELPLLPASLPPHSTSPTPPTAGTARLDMLLGNFFHRDPGGVYMINRT